MESFAMVDLEKFANSCIKLLKSDNLKTEKLPNEFKCSNVIIRINEIIKTLIEKYKLSEYKMNNFESDNSIIMELYDKLNINSEDALFRLAIEKNLEIKTFSDYSKELYNKIFINVKK